jgi:hypothetical protein
VLQTLPANVASVLPPPLPLSFAQMPINVGYCFLVFGRYVKESDHGISSDVRSPCLPVSSTHPSHLRSVIAMLQAHGIRTEEGLHRRWGSNEFVPH